MNEVFFGCYCGVEFDLIFFCDVEVNSVNLLFVDLMFNDSFV